MVSGTHRDRGPAPELYSLPRPGDHLFADVAVTPIRDTRIAWDRSGPRGGVPIVWGHGLTSSRSGEDLFPLVDLAKVRALHDVVRYDARGHGESDALVEPERASWAELAKDQTALVDHLGIEEVVLGGISMGVGTALHSAAMLGTRLQKLVLVIPPTGWHERAAQISVYEQTAKVLEAKGIDPLITAAMALEPPDPFRGSDDWHRTRASALRSADPVRLAANLRGAAHADLPSEDALAAIVAPTLVLAWSGDPGHPVSTADRLDAVLPNVHVVISSTVGDFATWTERTLTFLGD